MPKELPIFIDPSVSKKIKNLIKNLEPKGIILKEGKEQVSFVESAPFYCIMSQKAHSSSFSGVNEHTENPLILVVYRGNSHLFTHVFDLNDLPESLNVSLWLFGQIQWQLFLAEFKQYSVQHISSFMDLLRVGLMFFSSDGILLYANEELESLTGWNVETLSMKAPEQYLRFPEDLLIKHGLNYLFCESRKVGRLEFLFKDGHWRTLVYRSYLLPLPFLNTELLVILTDEQAFTENDEILIDFDRMQGKALFHDFRNLLQGVVTYIDLLGFEIKPGSVASTYLDKIRIELRRGQEVLRHLMNPVSHEESKVSIDQSIENLINTLKEIIPSNITIKFEGSCTSPVSVSQVDLGRILRNLVKNAVEAMGDAPGQIIIKTEKLPQEEEPDFMLLRISDTGPGIPTPLHPYVFEPYFTTRQGKGGSGLGLYSVYNIVKKYHGRINFESENGKGTTFVIFLPLAKN